MGIKNVFSEYFFYVVILECIASGYKSLLERRGKQILQTALVAKSARVRPSKAAHLELLY